MFGTKSLDTVCLHYRGVSFVLLQFYLECLLPASAKNRSPIGTLESRSSQKDLKSIQKPKFEPNHQLVHEVQKFMSEFVLRCIIAHPFVKW